MKEYRYWCIKMYKILRNLETYCWHGKNAENIILAKNEHHYACREDSRYYFKREKIVFSSWTPLLLLFFLRVNGLLNRMNLGFGVIQPSSMSSVFLLRKITLL